MEELLSRARACCGLEHRVDGEMGVRTAHQGGARAQMVLRVRQGEVSDDDGDGDDGALPAERADPTAFMQARPAAEAPAEGGAGPRPPPGCARGIVRAR